MKKVALLAFALFWVASTVNIAIAQVFQFTVTAANTTTITTQGGGLMISSFDNTAGSQFDFTTTAYNSGTVSSFPSGAANPMLLLEVVGGTGTTELSGVIKITVTSGSGHLYIPAQANPYANIQGVMVPPVSSSPVIAGIASINTLKIAHSPGSTYTAKALSQTGTNTINSQSKISWGLPSFSTVSSIALTSGDTVTINYDLSVYCPTGAAQGRATFRINGFNITSP